MLPRHAKFVEVDVWRQIEIEHAIHLNEMTSKCQIAEKGTLKLNESRIERASNPYRYVED